MWRTIGVVCLLVLLGASAFLYQPDKDAEALKLKYSSATSQFLKMDGVEVHYRDEGQGDVLLLLHGTGASLHTWDGWAAQLTRDFRVIRLDLPGFGLTGPNVDRNYTLEYYAQFIDEFTQALQLERFALAGNSLGGGIAWMYALDHPHKVSKLVLLNSSGFPREGEIGVMALAKNPATAVILKNVTPRFFIRQNLEQVYFDDSLIQDSIVERYWDMTLREGNRQAFVDRVNASFVHPVERLQNLAMPVLILWGAHDSWIPVEHAERFHQTIPNSRLIIYPQAGHVPMEEIPLQTSLDTQTFLLE